MVLETVIIEHGSKSQSEPDGQLLDIGVLVQIWPTFADQPTLDVQDMMSNDHGALELWSFGNGRWTS